MAESLGRIGRYELVEVLGQGAMGIVYKAYDSLLDRTVALKTYHPDQSVAEEIRKRFEREVKAASRLHHPNIVVVYDGGIENDRVFIAMELVEGSTLQAELRRRGKLVGEQALAILLPISDALHYAHEQGVIHRDLKHANILLTAKGQPKIADFGVAKLVSSEATAGFAPMGTPGYMAPEQISGKPTDRRVDVFALGVLAYEVLTGERAFPGESLNTVFYNLLHVEPPAPSVRESALPQAFDEVIARALAKDPAARTPDAATFARELTDSLREKPGAPKAPPAPPPPPRPPPQTFSGEDFDSDAVRELARPRKEPTSRALLGVVGAVLLLLLGAGAFLFLSSRPEAPPPPVEATPAPAATPTAAPPAPTVTVAEKREVRTPPEAQRTPPPKRETKAPAQRAVPSSDLASVDIFSDPVSALVTMDGKPIGKTPMRLSDVPLGPHQIEVRKDGYVPLERSFEAEPKANYEISVTLKPIVNSLRILSSPPGAEVVVNGEPRGKTPVLLDKLGSGTYDVTVKLNDKEQQRKVELKDGRLEELLFTFSP